MQCAGFYNEIKSLGRTVSVYVRLLLGGLRRYDSYTYYLPSVRPRGPNKKTRRATNNHREGFPILALEGREQLGNLEFFL